MDIYVLNANLQKIGMIEDFSSCIWTTKFYTYGDFELVLPATANNLSLMQCGNYLVRDKDYGATIYKNVMRIFSREIKSDIENGDDLIVTGYDLKSILKQRIIPRQTNLYGKPNVCINNLVDQNLVNPTDPDRAIAITIDSSGVSGSYPTIRQQITGKNLADAVASICQKYKLGYEVYIDDGAFIFRVVEGKDRSNAQSTNPRVVFSPGFDNLLSSDYLENKENFANLCYVAGEGEGTGRTIVEVGTAAGLARFETWLDDRIVSSNEGEVSQSDYEEALAQDGEDLLSQKGITSNFGAEVLNTINYKFGKDYNLGDIVQIETAYGVNYAPRIVEMIESLDRTGEELVPTFEI